MNNLLRYFVCSLLFLCNNTYFFAQNIDSKSNLFIQICNEFKWEEEKKESFEILIIGDAKLFDALTENTDLLTIDVPDKFVKFGEHLPPSVSSDVIYVNAHQGIPYRNVYEAIPSEKCLFISENYKFENSMVSLLNTSDNYVLGLNRGKIKKAGFKIPKKLKRIALNSTLKWSENSHDSEQTATNVKTINEDTSTTINEDNLDDSSLDIFYMLEQINQLKNKIANDSNLISQKITELDSLEAKINLQYLETSKQASEIALHKEEIDNQKAALNQQNQIIKNQKSFFWLLGIVIILFLILMLVFWRSNSIKKKNMDLLEKKNFEINQKNQEIERLVYIASHDLRSPVDTILGFVELLEFKLENKLSEDDLLNMYYIKQSSKRMRLLIKDLLDYAKISSEKPLESFLIEDLIVDIREDLNSKIENSDASLYVQGNTGNRIIGRKTEIRLLLQNLIENSIKFRKEDNDLVILFNHEQEIIKNRVITHCSISDNGIGIQEEFHNSIFEIFKKLHTNEEYSGTGIGLAHCKKIVERHKGKIWVDESYEEGAKICFTLSHVAV